MEINMLEKTIFYHFPFDSIINFSLSSPSPSAGFDGKFVSVNKLVNRVINLHRVLLVGLCCVKYGTADESGSIFSGAGGASLSTIFCCVRTNDLADIYNSFFASPPSSFCAPLKHHVIAAINIVIIIFHKSELHRKSPWAAIEEYYYWK